MKFAKKCVIMVDVNKKVRFCTRKLRQLYNVHKFTAGFLWKPKKGRRTIQ